MPRSFSLTAFAKLQREGCKTTLTCKPHPDPEVSPSEFFPVLCLSLLSSPLETHLTPFFALVRLISLSRSTCSLR